MNHSMEKPHRKKKLLSPALAVLAGCLLTACTSPWFSSITTRSGQAYFLEDFADISSGWPQMESATGNMGTYEGMFSMTVTSPESDLVAVPPRAFLDVRLEVDTAKAAGSDNNRFGLICRYKDPANFYMFIISSDGYYALGKVQDGNTTLLGQEAMAFNRFILTGSATNHLRMDCQDDTLTGWINGELVAITQDKSFDHGKVGFILGSFEPGGVQVYFDHLAAVKP